MNITRDWKTTVAERAERDPASAKALLDEIHGIDLDIAFRKMHEWGLADGDLGYAYWYQVRQLLERAAGMQAEIDALREELKRRKK